MDQDRLLNLSLNYQKKSGQQNLSNSFFFYTIPLKIISQLNTDSRKSNMRAANKEKEILP